MSRRSRGTVTAVAAVAAAVLLGACSSGVYEETKVPVATPTVTPAPSGSATATPAACDNATQSYNPLPALTGDAANKAVADIKSNGRLKVGVSADSLLLGSRNPVNGQIEGFDIDMVKAVAKAIFGDETKYQLRVITAAQRIPALQDGDVLYFPAKKDPGVPGITKFSQFLGPLGYLIGGVF